jgi:quercetin dioxygenase-like cupin family protein
MCFINYNTKNKATIFPGIHSAMAHSDKSTFGCVTLEAGVVAPIHSHPHEQWTYVLEGEIEFTLNGETQLLLPGMGAFIASNILHGAKSVTACKVIDVFTTVREDYKAMDNEK